MTLKEQQKWLRDRQKEHEHCLRESQTMVIGESIVANAQRDLEAVTALLATLDTIIRATLPLFAAPPPPEGDVS